MPPSYLSPFPYQRSDSLSKYTELVQCPYEATVNCSTGSSWKFKGMALNTEKMTHKKRLKPLKIEGVSPIVEIVVVVTRIT